MLPPCIPSSALYFLQCFVLLDHFSSVQKLFTCLAQSVRPMKISRRRRRPTSTDFPHTLYSAHLLSFFSSGRRGDTSRLLLLLFPLPAARSVRLYKLFGGT